MANLQSFTDQKYLIINFLEYFLYDFEASLLLAIDGTNYLVPASYRRFFIRSTGPEFFQYACLLKLLLKALKGLVN